MSLLVPSVALSLALNLTIGVVPTRASSYNNTDPAATVCWNGSHPVQILSAYYIRRAGFVFGRIDFMYSDYCNTVWARVKNLSTNAGGGVFATPEQQLVADEQISVYSCPNHRALCRRRASTATCLRPYSRSPTTMTRGSRQLLPEPGLQSERTLAL